KVPVLVEESEREFSLACAACGRAFRPLRQTAQPTWTSPPLRPDPPPPPTARTPTSRDLWSEDPFVQSTRPAFLPGQQAGRTAQGLLLLVSLMELAHAGMGCLALYSGGDWQFNLPRDIGAPACGCSCLFAIFQVLAAVFTLVWLGYAYANLPSLGVTG